MLEQNQINKIKELAREFFDKMTIELSFIDVGMSPEGAETGEGRDVVDLDIRLDEPQILIGQQGQTLFEIQRLLRTILNRKLQKVFYLNLDINEYKKKKMEYLKDLAKSVADNVFLNKKEESLQPMSAYERRIIHSSLSQRTDVLVESEGDGLERHIVIKPK